MVVRCILTICDVKERFQRQITTATKRDLQGKNDSKEDDNKEWKLGKGANGDVK